MAAGCQSLQGTHAGPIGVRSLLCSPLTGLPPSLSAPISGEGAGSLIQPEEERELHGPGLSWCRTMTYIDNCIPAEYVSAQTSLPGLARLVEVVFPNEEDARCSITRQSRNARALV
jgi:hypothetical protein